MPTGLRCSSRAVRRPAVRRFRAATARSWTSADNSTGGTAALTLDGTSSVDFSDSTGPAGDDKFTIGSLAGAGSFYLGHNMLSVGRQQPVDHRKRRHQRLRQHRLRLQHSLWYRDADQGRHRYVDAHRYQPLHRRHRDQWGYAQHQRRQRPWRLGHFALLRRRHAAIWRAVHARYVAHASHSIPAAEPSTPMASARPSARTSRAVAV